MRQVQRYSHKLIFNLLISAIICFFIFPSSADCSDQIQIKHKPIKYYITGKRIQLEAAFQDPSGISIARCYFREKGNGEFFFVSMAQIHGNTFQGILPKTSKASASLEYLFLAVNGENQVVKTQLFSTPRKDTTKIPSWQKIRDTGDITIATELQTAPDETPGFSDSIIVDVVESSARFGMVAGIYSISTAGASGAAASSTATGTVSATAGISTTTIGVAAAGAAVAGAVVAGGGDDGPDPVNIAGTWTGTFQETSPSGEPIDGSWDMDVAESNQFTLTQIWSEGSRVYTGIWSISGSHIESLVAHPETGDTETLAADIEGDAFNGSLSSSSGHNIILTGSRSGGIEITW